VKDMEQPPVQSEMLIDSSSSEKLKVEIRVHAADDEGLEAGRDVAPLVAARGWVVHLLVLTAVLAIAAAYVGAHIGTGWIPGDEGTLSQSALRVLQGELPHRDFVEIYTGGLSFIHALAFRLFGVNLMSLRICVFLFCLAWLPAVYYITLRFTSPIAAGVITLLTVAWSYPVYPAAMPSWYNLFFATFGAAALLRYLEVRTRRWLFVAGVCGGVSILIKVIGAYYVAGVLLFLAFLEQSESVSESASKSPNQNRGGESSRDGWPYRAFSACALLLFLATLIALLRPRLGTAELYQFILPSVVVVGVILLGERTVQAGTGRRFRTIFGTVIPFVFGLATPLIAFLALYARSGAIGQLLSGVTSSAITRSIALGVIRPASIEKSIFALALVVLVAAAMYWREFQGKIVGAAVGLGLTVMLVKAATSNEIVSGVWYSAATLTPLVVLLGAASVVLSAVKWGGRTPSCAPDKLRQQRVMVLISLAATCGLVQYPFAAPYYLCYALPLTLLAAVAIVSTAKKQPGTYVLAAVAGFYLLFSIGMVVPAYIYEILVPKVGPMDELRLARAGGLRIEYAANFADLIHLLQQHSPNGLMYAGNDCPELYFLAGLKNVTRDDGGAPPEEVLRALQSDDLKVVVINEAPFYPSARMSPAVRAEVDRKFPYSSQSGIFHVFWRE
jgi:Dolichyl-phosphate-mannose-protein mannosyltransferase